MNKKPPRYFPKVSSFGLRQARALFDIEGLLKLCPEGRTQRATAKVGQVSRWNE